MKKLINLLLVLCLFVLTACGGSDEPDQPVIEEPIEEKQETKEEYDYSEFFGTWEFVGIVDEDDEFYGEEELGDEFYELYTCLVIDSDMNYYLYSPIEDGYAEGELIAEEDALFDEDGAIYLVEDEILFVYFEDDTMISYVKISDSQDINDVYALFEEEMDEELVELLSYLEEVANQIETKLSNENADEKVFDECDELYEMLFNTMDEINDEYDNLNYSEQKLIDESFDRIYEKLDELSIF